MQPASPQRNNRRNESSRYRGATHQRQNFITRIATHWWNRLLGVAAEGSYVSQEEEYGAHRTSHDYIWNTIGLATNNMVFPILTMVVTQLCGAEQAGMFSLAFVTGLLLMFVGNYGVRTYQVSDQDEVHTFADYRLNRIITCVAMILIGVLYSLFRGYAGLMFTITIGVCVYKMIDALADVFEGRLQQKDKMYLAGISQAFRSVVVFIVFTIALTLTRNVGVASVAMAVTALGTFFFLTLPLGLLETPRSRHWTVSSIAGLFRQCFPLFMGHFLYNLIDNMPKFVMEGVLSYDNQLYFNALYFPSQMILIIVQLIYKPLLLRLSEVWADPSQRKRFNQVVFVMLAITVVITLVMIVIMGWIGIPMLSLMYGVDFEPYRVLCYLMLIGGGITAVIDFLYQVITVLRRQDRIVKLYLIATAFSVVLPLVFINLIGLTGAVISYVASMVILFVLMTMEYVTTRREIDGGKIDVASITSGGGRFEVSVPKMIRQRRSGGIHAQRGTRRGANSSRREGAQNTGDRSRAQQQREQRPHQEGMRRSSGAIDPRYHGERASDRVARRARELRQTETDASRRSRSSEEAPSEDDRRG